MAFQVRILNAAPSENCAVGSSLVDFSGKEISVPSPGVYTVYRDADRAVEVQAHFRSCSLSPMCTCAVAARSGPTVAVLDACTKGHLQVWAWGPTDGDESDMDILSIDEGREYKVGVQ